MASEEHRAVAERFQMALHLFDLSERMLRQKLRRKYPQATEVEIEAQVVSWLEHRPGAEHGDGVGKPVPWPRRR